MFSVQLSQLFMIISKVLLVVISQVVLEVIGLVPLKVTQICKFTLVMAQILSLRASFNCTASFTCQKLFYFAGLMTFTSTNVIHVDHTTKETITLYMRVCVLES